MATTAGLGADPGALPRRIRQLNWRTWRGVLARAGKGFVNDNCSDWAASLTYYTVLALFPSAMVVVALVNLVSQGDRTVDTVVGLLRDMGAASLVQNQSVVDAIKEVVSQKSSAGVLLSFGLVTAVWSASGYVSGFTRASNAIYGVEEGRPVWKLRPLQILLTMAALVLLALVALLLIVSGPVTTAIGERLGLGEMPRLLWTVAKWPVLVVIAMLLLALLFWIAPNVQQPRFRWLTVGGFVTLVAIALASFGFGLYVANFHSYDKTYGSLGAVIAFLVWVYLVNSAVMLGVEVNAELQRGRELQAGADKVEDPVLPPRAPAG
jgi:membrane protein